MSKKKCLVCGALFNSIPSRIGTYCSQSCMSEGYRILLIGELNPNFKYKGRKSCCYCNKIFISYRKQRPYCSRICYANHKKETTLKKKKEERSLREALNKVYPFSRIYTRNCKYCNKPMVNKTNTLKVCKDCHARVIIESNKKSALTQQHKIFIKCPVCNNDFRVSLSTSKRIYCSFKCRAVKLSGDGNPNYIDGRTSLNSRIRNTQKYKDWRLSVFKRDNYTCVWCGKKGGTIHADHIKPFAAYPELRFELSNGRTLCKPCHMKTDTYLKQNKRVSPIIQFNHTSL